MNPKFLKKLGVLYVEDEAAVRESVRRNIAPFVREVITAANGEEGLARFRENHDRIDLIVTDIMMPKMNGIEMVDAIRKEDPEIPVIYATAFDDRDSLLRTIQQSVSAYILKPIDLERLLESFQQAAVRVENRQLRKSLQENNRLLEDRVRAQTREIREKNEELIRRLLTDNLTGLPNRTALKERISIADSPALLLVDIDRFRSINESYGERIGNEVLVLFAHLLERFGKERGLQTYRLGSDVFALFTPECAALLRCERTAAELLAYLNRHEIQVPSYEFSVQLNATLGIAEGRDKLIEKASMALQHAKKNSHPYLVYTEAYNTDAEYQHDMRWKKLLKKSIEKNEITLYLQPITDREKRPVHYEALMRIKGEELHSPARFLPIAKKVKLFTQLSYLATDKALEICRDSGCHININIEVENIEDSSFVSWLKKRIETLGIAPRITLEILESENIRDYGTIVAFFDEMHRLGCKVALDDFGSGYSNFVYLQRLRPDYIKIDGSLVREMDQDENARIIVRSINDFAHNLDIRTVAEHVHSAAIFEELKAMGVDYFQGYYLGRPAANEQLRCPA
ncbi:EAL domain-containing response regulator [Nitratifractor sp.]|uniref:EAL domain-containing response regulator n=1 Tax=Nitratifractor sp. TaxID=2268144 RepID=UPI0025F0966A|nr:EAL domain-containing response regulator [Nitratifractor sp.]